MGPELLLREIGTALIGALGAWAIQVAMPLQDNITRVLQGGVVLATLYVMAHQGGVL